MQEKKVRKQIGKGVENNSNGFEMGGGGGLNARGRVG